MARRRLPPDPERMNADRAAWAQSAIDAFQAETRTDDESALIDLLADLQHWADRNGRSFEDDLDSARSHYAAETTRPECIDSCGRAATTSEGRCRSCYRSFHNGAAV